VVRLASSWGDDFLIGDRLFVQGFDKSVSVRCWRNANATQKCSSHAFFIAEATNVGDVLDAAPTIFEPSARRLFAEVLNQFGRCPTMPSAEVANKGSTGHANRFRQAIYTKILSEMVSNPGRKLR
jgi:hypothetical protein